MEMKYVLSDNTWGTEEADAIKDVLDSGRFTMGEKTLEFEKQFAKYFGAKYAIFSNSGSSANLLAIAALVYSGKLKAGDEVIVPAISWSTTFYPISQLGLKLRFVDVDSDTLNLEGDLIEKAITPKTKAVFAVNLLGNPANYEKIEQICKKYNLILIEDNCESMGGTFNGKPLGTFGVLGTFSSFFSHHICTMEGGMTITDDLELYHYMLAIRAHGWTRNLPEDSPIYKKLEDPFYESFNFIVPGYNLRPLEMEAATGPIQLNKLAKFVENRRTNAAYFKEKMDKLEGFKTQKETGASSWFGFAIILVDKNKGRRDDLVHILREKGVEVRPIVAGNFTRSKALEYMDHSIYGELESANYIHDNGFFVGNHSTLMLENIDYLCSILQDF